MDGSKTKKDLQKKVTTAVEKELTEIKAGDMKEIESELVQQAKERSEDPTQMAATGYAMYGHKLKEGLNMLSGKAAKRLFKALIDDKLGEKSYNLQGIEPQLLEVANFVFECKFIMLMDTYNQHAEQFADAANPDVELTEEEVKEIKKDLELNE